MPDCPVYQMCGSSGSSSPDSAGSASFPTVSFGSASSTTVSFAVLRPLQPLPAVSHPLQPHPATSRRIPLHPQYPHSFETAPETVVSTFPISAVSSPVFLSALPVSVGFSTVFRTLFSADDPVAVPLLPAASDSFSPVSLQTARYCESCFWHLPPCGVHCGTDRIKSKKPLSVQAGKVRRPDNRAVHVRNKNSAVHNQ